MPHPSRPRHFIATYHYVRPENSDGVTGITPEAFERQLRAIAAGWDVVGVDEFIARESEASGLALITFDDAVRDQYTWAAPILESLGMPAVFFAPMRPFDPVHDDRPDQQWIAQHLLHALAEQMGWPAFERAFDAAVAARSLRISIDLEHMNELYHYEVPAKRRLKYSIAFALDPSTVAGILTEINAEVGLQARDWFMGPGDLIDLERRGFAIAGHGYDHFPYSTMTADQQRDDLRRAREVLDALLGPANRSLAYPFGRSTSVTAEIAAELGYTRCFGTEERIDAREVLEVAEASMATDSSIAVAPAVPSGISSGISSGIASNLPTTEPMPGPTDGLADGLADGPADAPNAADLASEIRGTSIPQEHRQ
ncbi:MAG: polysaccharide deacetylase family protein [Phycisphaerales bacterium]